MPWIATIVAAAMTTRPASSDSDAFLFQQLDDSEGGARHTSVDALDERTDAAWRHAVDIFFRCDGVEDS